MKILIPILGIAAIIGASWWYMNNKDSFYNKGEDVNYEEGWELPDKESVGQDKKYEDRTTVVDPTNVTEPQFDSSDTDTTDTDTASEIVDGQDGEENTSSTENLDEENEESTVPANPIQVGEVVVVGDDAVAPETAPSTVAFTVLGSNYHYDVKEIKVKEGDEVTINFQAAEGFHDWVVDEFSAATEKVRDGAETSVTFVADKKGTFEYYCSVGQHRANGMVGTLIVE